MSIWDIHYDALYRGPIAVDAVLTLDGTDAVPIEMRAIDKTVGQAIGFKGVNVETVGPSANVRASELAEKSIDPDTVDDGILTLNGKDWKIVSHMPLPAPTGEGYGEIRLTLEAA